MNLSEGKVTGKDYNISKNFNQVVFKVPRLAGKAEGISQYVGHRFQRDKLNLPVTCSAPYTCHARGSDLQFADLPGSHTTKTNPSYVGYVARTTDITHIAGVRYTD